MDALVEEVLKELLLDVALIGKYFAVEHLSRVRFTKRYITLFLYCQDRA